MSGIEYFQSRAKELLRAVRSGNPDAVAFAASAGVQHEDITLQRAQHAVAVRAGYSQWGGPDGLKGASDQQLLGARTRVPRFVARDSVCGLCGLDKAIGDHRLRPPYAVEGRRVPRPVSQILPSWACWCSSPVMEYCAVAEGSFVSHCGKGHIERVSERKVECAVCGAIDLIPVTAPDRERLPPGWLVEIDIGKRLLPESAGMPRLVVSKGYSCSDDCRVRLYGKAARQSPRPWDEMLAARIVERALQYRIPRDEAAFSLESWADDLTVEEREAFLQICVAAHHVGLTRAIVTPRVRMRAVAMWSAAGRLSQESARRIQTAYSQSTRRSEERTGHFRRDTDGEVLVILDRGDAKDDAPHSELPADGRWHDPTAYGDPHERLDRLGRVKVSVEYDDLGRYRITTLLFDGCPICGSNVFRMREWKPGTPRHVHRATFASLRSSDGTVQYAGIFCDDCKTQLGSDQACESALIRERH